MIIPFQKEVHIFVPLKEGIILKKDNFFLEAAHAFNEQYNWAWKCAENVLKAIKLNIKQFNISFDNDDFIKGANIVVETPINYLRTKGEIKGFIDGDYIKIEILPNVDILKKTEHDAISEIWEAIVHELGHGNIFWHRKENNVKVEDYPKDYEKWKLIIQNKTLNANDIEYLFCYALYSTYYQEVQAFVSQTYSSLFNIIHNRFGTTKITKEQFNKAVIDTNTFQIYKLCNDIADSLLNDAKLRKELKKRLDILDFSYSEEQILKLCNRIKIISNDTLRAAYNNAYQWFYKSFAP